MNLIPVEEAERIVLGETRLLPAARCLLAEAHGLVLREEIRADRDQPPFDRVLRDGIAVALSGWNAGQRRFAVQSTQQAGDTPRRLADPGAGCIEVMTGTALPEGCDLVIPVEALEMQDGRAVVVSGVSAEPGLNVHRKGSDRQAKDVLVGPGTVLGPQHIAVAASVGRSSLLVSAMPSAAVVSTGNELVGLDEPMTAYQIRMSNGHALRAALASLGCRDVRVERLGDDRDLLKDRIGQLLAERDLLVLSGGVSAGKTDFVPGVLAELGVEALFHQVSQRPGKPMWFGVASGGKAVFALPGNPVAALVCFHRYVLPYLRACSATVSAEPEFVELAAEIAFDLRLTYFPPVRVAGTPEGRRQARPVAYGGSDDIAALGESSGFVELPAGAGPFPAGSVVRFHSWVG